MNSQFKNLPISHFLIANAEYYYDPEAEVEELYAQILANKASLEAYAILSKNFVLEESELLKVPGVINIKHSENVLFDKERKVYSAKEAGYVSYKHNRLNVFPFFHINEDKTKCHAIVPLKHQVTQIFTATLVEKALDKLLIGRKVAGFADAVMETFRSNKGGCILVAEGKDPIQGCPEKIEMLIDIETKAGRKTAKGKIDYKDKGYVINVREGDEVATYYPAIEPHDGVDIYNKPIPAKMDETDYKIGSGLKIDLNENKVLASTDGVLKILEDHTVSVVEILIIYADVDISIGNLDVNGSLEIRGDVHPGLSIKTKKNLWIHGNLEESNVYCAGDLKVSGGIISNKENEIIVGGNAETSFIRNGVIKAKGNIAIKDFSMNSVLYSGERIEFVNARKGKVIGGKISGFKGISVHTVGNNNAVKTTLVVGIDVGRDETVKKLHTEIKKMADNILKFKNVLGREYFRDPKLYMAKAPKRKIPVIQQIIENLKKMIQQKKISQSELEKLLEENELHKYPSIKILKEIYEGTTLQIGNKVLDIQKPVKSPTCYVYNATQNRIIPTAVKKEDN